MMKRLGIFVFLLVAVTPLGANATNSTPVQQLLSKLQWRSIGPYIGGRVVAVAGVASNRDLFYMGGVEGGVWKSTDYGQNWSNISDGKIPGIADSIGALAVAPSNPSVIYAGTGEADIRSDFDSGDGVYKTTDAGQDVVVRRPARYPHDREDRRRSAQSADCVCGLHGTRLPAQLANAGIFKTIDGGKTWSKVLFVNDNTGGIDLAMDSRNPNALYAAMWQAQRVPWKLTSGGPGSGLYKTLDGGAPLDEDLHQPRFCHRSAGEDRRRGRGERSAHRVRDRAGARRRRLPLQRCRPDVEARQRRDGSCASARSTTWRSYGGSHQSTSRLRAGSRRHL